jgi:hypothetical protein
MSRPLRLKEYHDYVGITKFIQKEKKMKVKKEVVKPIRLSRLRRSWEKSGLSMAALGKKVGLHRNQVWYAVHGRPVAPALAAKFATALGVKLASLRS